MSFLDLADMLADHEKMVTKKQADQSNESATGDDYIWAATVARMYGVSASTVRRRILEGAIFPGAKKMPMPFSGAGEVWMIPRSEVVSLSLEDLSPRAHYRRAKATREAHDQATRGRSLEERVGVLETLMVKVLDRLPDQDEERDELGKT
jgi:hypothetical protein